MIPRQAHAMDPRQASALDPRRSTAMAVFLAAVLLPGLGACAGMTQSDGASPSGSAEPGPPVGLHVVRALEFPPIQFDPPEPERFELSNGVTVFFLRDQSIPLVDVFVSVRGGYAYFDRSVYGPASALPSLVRNGGTRSLPPDSLDELIEFHALGLTVSSNGARMMLGLSGLDRQIDLVADLMGDILLNPRFDRDAVERWRLRELEAVRRAGDFPGSLAVLRFNRLAFGDHPTGWIMETSDLVPEKFEPETLRSLHQRIVCPEGAVIGAAGDVTREELEDALERALGDWEPCDQELETPAPPDLQ
ncbi:MAG TPA: hypothetical protein VK966_13490, partial [Longimicrobiales bacterium]|nr:hypothetical protein [Longimicrobiales bacterium]